MSSSILERLKQRLRQNPSPEQLKRPPSVERWQNHNVSLDGSSQEPLLDQIDFSLLLVTRDTPTDTTPPSRASTKRNILDEVLSKYSHLDLPGKIRGLTTAPCRMGPYSDIFMGHYPSSGDMEVKVAVNRLRVWVRDDAKFQKRLAKELYIWSQLHHPNILRLEGFYLEDDQYPSLVSRWMENGTVLDYLRANPDTNPLPIIIGTAQGLKYLHQSKIVHSDVKPDNVLISSSGMALLSDFGISRMLSASKTFQFSSTQNGGLKGTLQFMSKELLSTTDINPSIYSKQSDVWAFGMTVYTILTKRRPYDDIGSGPQVMQAIKDGILPYDPDNVDEWPIRNKAIFRLAQSCWRTLTYRPGIENILGDLVLLEGLAAEGYSTIVSPIFSDFTVHKNPTLHAADVALQKAIQGAAL